MVKAITDLVVEGTVASGVDANDGPDVDPVPSVEVDPVTDSGVTGTYKAKNKQTKQINQNVSTQIESRFSQMDFKFMVIGINKCNKPFTGIVGSRIENS